MKIYFNMKSQYGVETVDSYDSSEFKSMSEFYTEVKRCLIETRKALGMNIYRSSRCTKYWKETHEKNRRK